jgi:hypothetical protein
VHLRRTVNTVVYLWDIHLLPHTHAQTNHGAPAMHRDNLLTVSANHFYWAPCRSHKSTVGFRLGIKGECAVIHKKCLLLVLVQGATTVWYNIVGCGSKSSKHYEEIGSRLLKLLKYRRKRKVLRASIVAGPGIAAALSQSRLRTTRFILLHATGKFESDTCHKYTPD